MSGLTLAQDTAETAPAPDRDAPSGRRSRSRLLSRGAVNTVLVLAAVYSLFPVLWMLLAAMKNNTGLASGIFDFHHIALGENLSGLIHTDHGIYLRWCLNSVLYAGIGSAVCALISVAAGYAFDTYHFRGKEKLFGAVLLGVLVPSAATVIPMYLMFSKLHLVNTVWAVLIPSVVNPFGVYLGRVFSLGYVPDEVIEAARVDGAGEIRIFGSIALPMLRSGFTTIMLFQFSAIWNGFFLALVMLSDKNLYPVTLGVYIWQTESVPDPSMTPLALTGATVAVLPVLVLFICLQRYWRSGLTAGSVK